MARWSQYREEYTQPERNIIYERIIKAALGYNIAVKYNPDLPEVRALPTAIKEKLEGYEATDAMICKVAKNIEEAIPLIEAGFEKHDEFNGVHIYRKRK